MPEFVYPAEDKADRETQGMVPAPLYAGPAPGGIGRAEAGASVAQRTGAMIVVRSPPMLCDKLKPLRRSFPCEGQHRR